MKSLARKLDVHPDTLKKLIKPIAHKLRIKEENRKIITPREVNVILEFLGVDKNKFENKK